MCFLVNLQDLKDKETIANCRIYTTTEVHPLLYYAKFDLQPIEVIKPTINISSCEEAEKRDILPEPKH